MYKNRLFEFELLRQHLLKNPNTMGDLIRYEKQFGTLPADIEDTFVFQDYLKLFRLSGLMPVNFPVFDYWVDWRLFMQLAFASFSSNVLLKKSAVNEKLDLFVDVNSFPVMKVVAVNTMTDFQVRNLFTIWVQEQLNLSYIAAVDEREREAIYEQRYICLDHYKAQIAKFGAPVTKQAEIFNYQNMFYFKCQ